MTTPNLEEILFDFKEKIKDLQQLLLLLKCKERNKQSWAQVEQKIEEIEIQYCFIKDYISKEKSFISQFNVKSTTSSISRSTSKRFSSGSNNNRNQYKSNGKFGGYSKIGVVGGSLLILGSLGSIANLDETSPLYKRQKATFDKYASSTIEGERHMTANDFLEALTTPDQDARGDQLLKATLDADKFKILFQIADVDHTGYISFDEYVMFDELMAKPDSEYFLAFKLFDRDGNGYISKNDFKHVVSASLDPSIPFNFDCDLVNLYFGNGKNELNYAQFTQLLKDLQQERVRQEFKYYDRNHSGYIPADKFAKILSSVKLRKIPDTIREHLQSISEMNTQSGHPTEVSYSQFVAANDMLLHIPSYGRVLRAALSKRKCDAIDKEEFLTEARSSTSIEITPMEADLIFHLFDVNKDGKLSLSDFEKATGYSTKSLDLQPVAGYGATPSSTTSVPTGTKTAFQNLMESIENFVLGSVAGGIGAAAVYPIDLVKTRMQNQRAVEASKRIYNNSWDCFKKVVRNEGFLGLYKGLGPQMVGVAPEKAIKLTVNDLLRNLFEDKSKGEIYFPLEVLAGGFAGMSQVCVTNPLEIVKIRLQVQSSGPKVSAIAVIKELGISGLYKGAGACLLRDIPFSAIYFPTYAKMKTILADENGKLGAGDLLLAGAIAGIPAASLVTPADVIKTRLQVKAKAGEQTYDGIRDCFVKIMREEGPKAFFKGCVARVCRSSPQFGVTLVSYELLQKYFAPHVTPRVPTNAPITQKDFAIIRGATAPVEKVQDMENKFGLKIDCAPNILTNRISQGKSCIPKDEYNVCELGTFCYSGNSTCLPYIKKEGETCDTDSNLCYPQSLLCDGDSQKCILPQSFGANETCKKQEECYKPLECIDGYCTMPESYECMPYEDNLCKYGEACFTKIIDGKEVNKCGPKIQEGGNCTTTLQCADFMVCTYPANSQPPDANMTCHKINSKQEGERCDMGLNPLYQQNVIPLPDCDTGKGLTCYGEKCVNFNEFLTPSSVNCNLTGEYCSNSARETCLCYAETGGFCQSALSFGAECKSHIENIVKCAIANKCQRFTNENSRTCLLRKCQEEICQAPNTCISSGFFRDRFNVSHEYLCNSLYPDPKPTTTSTTSDSTTTSTTSTTTSTTGSSTTGGSTSTGASSTSTSTSTTTSGPSNSNYIKPITFLSFFLPFLIYLISK
eukprot:gene4505-5618_t